MCIAGVHDCPKEGPAATLLGPVLDEVGLSQAAGRHRVVHDEQEAARLGFLGSPTVLINGRDPFAEPGQAPGLTCRLYRDACSVSGVPPVEQLRRLLLAGIYAGPAAPAGAPAGAAGIPTRTAGDPLLEFFYAAGRFSLTGSTNGPPRKPMSSAVTLTVGNASAVTASLAGRGR